MGAVISLELPPDLSEEWQRLPQSSTQQMIWAMFSLMTGKTYVDIETQTMLLPSLPDEGLWNIAGYRLMPTEETRLTELLDLGNQGQLTVADQTELKHLMDKTTDQMVLRATALGLLKERGYDLEDYRQEVRQERIERWHP